MRYQRQDTIAEDSVRISESQPGNGNQGFDTGAGVSGLLFDQDWAPLTPPVPKIPMLPLVPPTPKPPPLDLLSLGLNPTLPVHYQMSDGGNQNQDNADAGDIEMQYSAETFHSAIAAEPKPKGPGWWSMFPDLSALGPPPKADPPAPDAKAVLPVFPKLQRYHPLPTTDKDELIASLQAQLDELQAREREIKSGAADDNTGKDASGDIQNQKFPGHKSPAPPPSDESSSCSSGVKRKKPRKKKPEDDDDGGGGGGSGGGSGGAPMPPNNRHQRESDTIQLRLKRGLG